MYTKRNDFAVPKVGEYWHWNQQYKCPGARKQRSENIKQRGAMKHRGKMHFLVWWMDSQSSKNPVHQNIAGRNKRKQQQKNLIIWGPGTIWKYEGDGSVLDF